MLRRRKLKSIRLLFLTIYTAVIYLLIKIQGKIKA
jgi:hypothetical protein